MAPCPRPAAGAVYRVQRPVCRRKIPSSHRHARAESRVRGRHSGVGEV